MNATNTNTEPAGGMTPAGNEGTTPLPSLLPPPSEPPRQRADQDQSMANDISATKQLVNAIMGDGGIRQKLLKRGFDTQKLSAGLTLCKTAEDRWDDRQNAMSAQEKQTALVAKLADEARKAYADFREMARTEFKDEASLTALSLSSEVPDDLQVFLTEARGAYTSALKAEHQGKLSKVGYGPAELQAENRRTEGVVGRGRGAGTTGR